MGWNQFNDTQPSLSDWQHARAAVYASEADVQTEYNWQDKTCYCHGFNFYN